MFRRRVPRHFLHRLTGLVYPVMGWRRTLQYYRHRALRLPGTPASIARGLACGAAVSFTPFVGLHFVLAFATAYLIGGNLLAAAIGTIVGNPLTFFFIWLAIYKTGAFVLGMDPQQGIVQEFADIVMHEPHRIFTELDGFFLPVFLPMLVGCIPYVIAVWVSSFYLSRRVVRRYQARRRKRQHFSKYRLKKMKKAAKSTEHDIYKKHSSSTSGPNSSRR